MDLIFCISLTVFGTIAEPRCSNNETESKKQRSVSSNTDRREREQLDVSRSSQPVDSMPSLVDNHAGLVSREIPNPASIPDSNDANVSPSGTSPGRRIARRWWRVILMKLLERNDYGRPESHARWRAGPLTIPTIPNSESVD